MALSPNYKVMLPNPGGTVTWNELPIASYDSDGIPKVVYNDPKVKVLEANIQNLEQSLVILAEARNIAVAAFVKYGRHNPRCLTGAVCDCGFEQIEKLLNGSTVRR